MAAPKLIAEALRHTRAAADLHQANIVQSTDLKRKYREILLASGWLEEIIKGWYLLVRPDSKPGDSAAWYSNYWDFVRLYLNHYYSDYCLSAESSIDLHVGLTCLPRQIVVIVPSGGTVVNLPFMTSILTYADKANLPQMRDTIQGINVMTLAYALCRVSPNFFQQNPTTAEIALRSVRSGHDISKIVVNHALVRSAQRLIGAYEFIGEHDTAKMIQQDLALAGIKVVAVNPFNKYEALLKGFTTKSPYVARIKALWREYRQQIMPLFPKPTATPQPTAEFFNAMDDLYEFDAYNSLSIEGYKVTPALIEKVMNKKWAPDFDEEDGDQRNALAARGYFEAFNAVKASLKTVLSGTDPGRCVEKSLQSWYQALFSPAIQAMIVQPAELMGYRSQQVYIRNSRHTPLPQSALLDAMEVFFECLQAEPHKGVAAILGHYFFVYIHPFMDGNGRLARFILNLLLVAGGYPWAVIQMKARKQYINALETAHVEQNIVPFAGFVIEQMQKTVKLTAKKGK